MGDIPETEGRLDPDYEVVETMELGKTTRDLPDILGEVDASDDEVLTQELEDESAE